MVCPCCWGRRVAEVGAVWRGQLSALEMALAAASRWVGGPRRKIDLPPVAAVLVVEEVVVLLPVAAIMAMRLCLLLPLRLFLEGAEGDQGQFVGVPRSPSLLVLALAKEEEEDLKRTKPWAVVERRRKKRRGEECNRSRMK